MTTLSLVVTINSPPSTGMVLTPVSPFTGSGTTFTSPVTIATGAEIGSIAILPAGWQGVLSLSGTNAAKFSLSGANLIAASALGTGTYNVTINATP